MMNDLARSLREILGLLDVQASSRTYESDQQSLQGDIASQAGMDSGTYFGCDDTLSLSCFAARYATITAGVDYCILKLPFYSTGTSQKLVFGGLVRIANKTGSSTAFTLKASIDGGTKFAFTNANPTAAIAANTNGSSVQLSIDRLGGSGGCSTGWHTLEIWIQSSVTHSTSTDYVGFSKMAFNIFESPDSSDVEGCRYN